MTAVRRQQAGLILATLIFGAVAAADDRASRVDDGEVSLAAEAKQACVSAHHSGQIARKEGDLIGAREQFGSCAQPQCPAPIRKECAQWLFGVERELPTLVLRVTDGKGNVTEAAQMWLDDKPVFDRADGRALRVNPGAHSVRVQLGSGEVLVSQFVASEGEKLRILELKVPADAPPAHAVAEPVVTRVPPPPAIEESRDIPTATLVLGAVGAAALGTALYFEFTGWGHERDYNDCLLSLSSSSDCRSEHSAMKNSYVVGDILLGVGLVSLGVGGAIWWGSRSDSDKSSSSGFMVGASGAF